MAVSTINPGITSTIAAATNPVAATPDKSGIASNFTQFLQLQLKVAVFDG